jgi:hypothetical protein
MSTESDPLRKDLERLRRLKGLSPLTPAEADAELARTPDVPLSSEEIERLMAAAAAETRPGEPFIASEWDPKNDLAGVGAEDACADDPHALLLNRTQEEGDEGFAEDSEEPRDQGPSDDKEEGPPEGASPREPGT